MNRYAAFFACCICCSFAHGFPVPKPDETPKADPVNQIKVGMTQLEVQKILPDQFWCGGWLQGRASTDTGDKYLSVTVYYIDSNIHVDYADRKVISVKRPVPQQP
jgi:hypothetical protein